MSTFFFWACIGLLLYVYAAYPLLLALLPKLWRYRARYHQITPSVTLLISAYNEEATIAGKLENSLALDYPRRSLQILVAADGSSDRTPEIVLQYAGRGVELSYSPPRRGKMAAINAAMRRARGEIVVLSDANNTFDCQAIRHLVRPFSDASVGAVAGAKAIITGDGALGDSEGLYWRYESFIKECETALGCCIGVSGEILAIRRRLFETPPEHVINDDCYIALRLVRRGYRVAYAAQARSRERISATAKDEIARRARIFAGRFQALTFAPRMIPFDRPLIAWLEISHQYLRTLLPLAMLGALLSNILLVTFPRAAGGIWTLAPPANWLALAVQVAFYLSALMGSYTEHSSGPLKLLYIPTFLVNSNLAGLIGLAGLLTGRQTVIWKRVRRSDVSADLPKAA